MAKVTVFALGDGEVFEDVAGLVEAQGCFYDQCERVDQLRLVCRDLNWTFAHQKDPEMFYIFTEDWLVETHCPGGVN